MGRLYKFSFRTMMGTQYFVAKLTEDEVAQVVFELESTDGVLQVEYNEVAGVWQGSMF